MTGARGCGIALAVLLASAVACDALTGASKYSDAQCIAVSGLDSCASACTQWGATWNASTGDCTCGDGQPVCGGIFGAGGCCDEGFGPNGFCDETQGLCTDCFVPCGPACCLATGDTCLNSAIGACGFPYGSPKQSCAGGLTCTVSTLAGGTQSVDCCRSIAIPAGTFAMGRSDAGVNQCPAADVADGTCDVNEQPAHSVALSAYALDELEVTVGRFRAFVNGWDYKAIPGGAGGDALVSGAEWELAWNDALPTSRAQLESDVACMNLANGPSPALATWTTTPGANENLPITCVTWFEAFAFCVWDGGRLPTEAEWEYAAANGPASDLYPWGEAAPTPTLAVYDCGGDATPCASPPRLPRPVGSAPGGANVWGNLDLAGNVGEWVRDFYGPYSSVGDAGTEPAFVLPGYEGVPVLRGGQFARPADDLRAAWRGDAPAVVASPGTGIRCARAQ